MRSKHYTVVALILGLSIAMAARAESVEDRLHKGIYQEETVGDLDAAVKIYQKIVADEKANRPHVAQANYRLGMCYLKKGQKQQAIETFERLIAEFPKQAQLVGQAKGRLTDLGHVSDEGDKSRPSLVWSYPTLKTVSNLSPDGRYVAFRDAETGDLAVRNLATGKNRRLTHNELPFDGTTDTVRFSPDGKSIAYSWFDDKEEGRNAELRVIGTDGTGQRTLFHPGGDVTRLAPKAWFADGKQILGRLRKDDGTRQAVVVSVSDGAVRVIEGPDRKYGHLSLSPDGQYIAYDFYPNGRSGPEDIALLPIEGGEEIPVCEHPADDDLLGWSPDGRMLVFRSERRVGVEDVWVIQIKDGTPQGQPQCVAKGLGSDGTVGSGQITRDGSLYYRAAQRFSVSRFSSGVFVGEIEPDSGKLLAAPKPLPRPYGHRAISPEFSPDGKFLAYYVAPTFERLNQATQFGPGNIVVRSLETGQEREITVSPRFSDGGAWPRIRWNPNGRSILMFGRSEAGRKGLFQVDLATGNLNPLVLDAEQIAAPHWQSWPIPNRVESDATSWGEYSPDAKAVSSTAAPTSSRTLQKGTDIQTGV